MIGARLCTGPVAPAAAGCGCHHPPPLHGTVSSPLKNGDSPSSVEQFR
jgi:hypothetical protein